MENRYQREGENTVYVTKLPKYYVVGRGIRYKGNTKDIKISRELILDNFIGADTNDLVKINDFFIIVAHNYYRGQTLATTRSKKGRKYTKPMTAKDMASIINKSTRTVYRLLKWLKDRDIVRRGEDGAIVVNPDKLMLR